MYDRTRADYVSLHAELVELIGVGELARVSSPELAGALADVYACTVRAAEFEGVSTEQAALTREHLREAMRAVADFVEAGELSRVASVPLAANLAQYLAARLSLAAVRTSAQLHRADRDEHGDIVPPPRPVLAPLDSP